MDGIITQQTGFNQALMEPAAPVQQDEDPKTAELAKDFTYDGYQVVRKELFAHLRDPAVVIRRDSVAFNTACISGFEDVVYIQILVNPDERKMVVRRCDENAKDALRWCVAKPDKRRSRRMTNKVFSAKMYEMMDWNALCRYKILGHKITFEDENIYVFDLTEAEIFMDVKKVDAAEVGLTAEGESPVSAEGANKTTGKEYNTRRGYLPEEWKDTFGLPVEEHKNALNINIRDGYAEFITDK